MAGTVAGGMAAKETNLIKYGADFYSRIGKIGGSAKVPKGFAISGKAVEAGIKGGSISKRGKAVVNG